MTDPEGHSTSLAFPIHVGDGRQHLCVRRPSSLDVRFAEIARRVPEFGGAYVGGDGLLRLVLTYTSAPIATAAEAAVRDIIGADSALAAGPHRRPRRASTASITSWPRGSARGRPWRSRAWSAWASTSGRTAWRFWRRGRRGPPGRDPRADSPGREPRRGHPADHQADGHARQHGHDPVRSSAARSWRSARAGLTLGFVATRKGKRGYLTNSHCTFTQGGVEGTPHGQASSGDKIGDRDCRPDVLHGRRLPRRLPLPVQRQLVRADGRRGHQPARRRLPDRGHDLPGDAGDSSYPLGGETLHKMGRTTGESSGEVSDTVR